MRRLLILFGGVGGKQPPPQLVWAAVVGTHEMLACHCLPCPTQDIFFTNTWVYKLMCVSLEGTNGLLLPKLTNKAFSSFPLAFNMARETTPVVFFFFFFGF